MTHKEFKHTAEQLLTELPADIRQKIGNVAIILEDNPPSDQPDLLGLFHGVPYPDGDPTVPNQIVLYKNNIEASCDSDEVIREEIRLTLFHEIGHFLGMDEDDLEERGLG